MTGPKPHPPVGIANPLAVAMARSQAKLARRRAAINQCRKCDAFRLDEKPPTVHRPWCPDAKEDQRAEEGSREG